MKRVVIIGGGAAGLMAAHSAAENADAQTEILIIEKNERPARKVMITGKGRCNVTNNCDTETLISSTLKNPRFYIPPFHFFLRLTLSPFLKNTVLSLKPSAETGFFPFPTKRLILLMRSRVLQGLKMLS